MLARMLAPCRQKEVTICAVGKFSTALQVRCSSAREMGWVVEILPLGIEITSNPVPSVNTKKKIHIYCLFMRGNCNVLAHFSGCTSAGTVP